MSARRALCLAVLVAGCGGVPKAQVVADARAELHRAMAEPVATRDERDRLSRLMLDEVDKAELEHMSVDEVQAQFGQGNLCRNEPVCVKNGFGGDDLFYPVGVTQNDQIKQLPTVVFGFDGHGRVQRVFTLKTH